MNYKENKWTHEEIEKLNELYQIYSTKDIAKLMDKSESSILNAIGRYKIKCNNKNKKIFATRRYWTEDELNYVKILYNEGKSINEIATTLDRSIGSVRDILYRLNLVATRDTWFWTEEEDLILKDNNNLSINELQKLLPHRTKHSISGRKSTIGAYQIVFKSPYKFRGKHGREHEYVMSNYLNRQLEDTEHVHHINCNTRDNKIENLYLTDNSNHKKIHIQLNKLLNSIVPFLLKNGIIKFNDGIYYSDETTN